MISTIYISAIQAGEKVLTGIGEEPDFSFSQDFLFKIILAVVAGLLIGIEREYKGKDAGLKTNMLVSVGACAFVILSLQYQGGKFIDLTRVLSQVVTGIGFLGAGVILKKKDTIQGLTTAATVWCSAAAGCLAALYLVTDLILFTGTVLLINLIFGLIGKKINE
ncbi:MgtC/SapB family protein [Aequorivita viscosa]|uniref:Putative Mg2+ transporter-C (MgtC) family protein n=1 Tax=Aequorivita viscosa TaxID=797419 RepID=A0A1M6NVH8_9FLAO|nr:MgtC/SapB family protein [Aequorivita viscosa]SDX48941.1 putative Mg2+ transporter-C (MgtC) family protein [Aequorivita viscosa]SHJ99747.1 putative Mg2+ transporter-C (MgtC) family protein [Aequorivita viscosa]